MIYLKKHYGTYLIEEDELCPKDSIEIDRRAARTARDRYHDHIDRLYSTSSTKLEDTITWLILPRGIGVFNVFKIYYLHARLNILLSEQPQPVYRCSDVRPAIDSLLASLCEEYNVDYRVSLEHRSKKHRPCLRSSLDLFENRFPQHVAKFQYFRRWFIYFLFVVLRPIILNLYRIAREPINVRFWIAPELPDRDRFFDGPDNLNSEGRSAGYACYDSHDTSSVYEFISSFISKGRRAFDPDQPIPVEWYAKPEDFRRIIELAPHVTEITRRIGERENEYSNSPDFTFLVQQLQTVSTEVVFEALFVECAIRGFGEKVDDDLWTHTQNLSKVLPRFLSIIGSQEDIASVAIANHYYSEMRVMDQFTDREIEGPEAVILPDHFVVWDVRSATNLQKQGIPADKITISRDKIEAEARDLEEDYSVRHPHASTKNATDHVTEERSLRVFVPLQETYDDIGMSIALEYVSNSLPNVKFVFKRHPYYHPPGKLVDLLEDDDFVIKSADTSLETIIKSCHICVSIYSTAALPALTRAKPVIWIPFASPNHFKMDLMEEVGIQADDPEDLLDTLKRLAQDETFYEEQARKCAHFAEEELVPDADAPSLANLLAEAGNDG